MNPRSAESNCDHETVELTMHAGGGNVRYDAL